MKTQKFHKSSYFITFIDDFTRICWVSFIKRKDEAFDYFKEFKNVVEKQSGYSMKFSRSNRVGEYYSNDVF